MKTVYIQGCFDIFHEGHLNILRRASWLGSITVGLRTDQSIMDYKKKIPIRPFMIRKTILEGCRYVNRVLGVETGETAKLIEFLNPDYVVLGTDWVTKDIYKHYGIKKSYLEPKLVYFPYTQGVSSTILKEKLKND